MPKYAAAITTPITAIETIAPTRSLIAKPPSRRYPPSSDRIATPGDDRDDDRREDRDRG